MQVQLTNALQIADQFEALLEANGISIPAHEVTGADMLPIWHVLQALRNGFNGTPDDLRDEYTAGIAVHDLAAKVLAAKNHPKFHTLLPHLNMLAQGAVHLTQEPPPDADVYNKMIEVYWACLLMSAGVDVEIDHPKQSTGFNPDVISLDQGIHARAYAFKTVRSPHTQNLLDHLVKGIGQIEVSKAKEGIVAFNLTPRILKANLWPVGGYYLDWQIPAGQALAILRQLISQIVIDNGQQAIDAIFAGKKTAGSVLCVALFPTVAKNPISGNPVVMPIKVATLVNLVPGQPPSSDLINEISLANDVMQLTL